jgi:hypothetical protein
LACFLKTHSLIWPRQSFSNRVGPRMSGC